MHILYILMAWVVIGFSSVKLIDYDMGDANPTEAFVHKWRYAIGLFLGPWMLIFVWIEHAEYLKGLLRQSLGHIADGFFYGIHCAIYLIKVLMLILFIVYMCWTLISIALHTFVYIQTGYMTLGWIEYGFCILVIPMQIIITSLATMILRFILSEGIKHE
jgi:hypothetical protein